MKNIQDHNPASLKDLYRYIGNYYVLLIIAIFNALIAGWTCPARFLFIRDTINEVAENTNLEDKADGIRDITILYYFTAGIGGIWWYIFCFIFIMIGAKISYELKWRYLTLNMGMK